MFTCIFVVAVNSYRTFSKMLSDEEASDSVVIPMSLEERLLTSSRTGDVNTVLNILKLTCGANESLEINWKGQHKCNLGWTALHLACYFGHPEIVKLLLEHGADPNVCNNTGDTALHKAAYTGREDLVLMLLSSNANVFVKNGEGQTAWDICQDSDIQKLLKAAEETDLRKKNDSLLHASREGDLQVIERLLKEDNPPDINCTDFLGNTALHCAAYRNKREVAVLLLQNGIDSSVQNKRGQLAIDLANNSSMKQILGVQPVKELQRTVGRFEGLLLRKSRFLGWRQVWTVLEKGVISFFTSRADAATGTRRRGYKYLDGAKVLLDENDVAVFVIIFSNNNRQRYSVPFVSQQQIDRQKWANAVMEHIEFSTHYLKQGFSEESDAEDDIDCMPVGTMQDKLQTAQAHQRVFEKLIDSVKGTYIDITKDSDKVSPHFIEMPWIILHQQLDLLIDSARRVSSSLSHCLTIFSQQEEVRLLQLKQQQERCRVLQDALHALAQEHHELEKSFTTSPFHSPPRSPLFHDTDCDEFFDAFEGDYSPPLVSMVHNESDVHSVGTAVESETGFYASFSSPTTSFTEPLKDTPQSKWGRPFLPVPMFSRNDFSVWSILKQCIGKELSKITMPVVFNEPLSFLQRLAENMEYCYLLDKADQCDDPVKRMEYVASFAVAAISSNWERLGKPFNPLLGETFELVREDMGFRIVCEQVSHHPPVSAFHADSAHFTFTGSIHPKLKLWARSVEIKPEGTVTVQLRKHNEVYTWSGVTCCVHNIIVGKLWMEQCGTMDIICHSNGLSASLTFKPAGWFSKDLNCVEGFIFDRQKTRLRFLFGEWCSFIRSADPDLYEEYVKLKDQKLPSACRSAENLSCNKNGAKYNSNSTSKQLSEESNGPSDASFGDRSCSIYIENSFESSEVWKADICPEYSKDYYHFTLFAMALNELQEGMESRLPPTDCRLRPDIRKLEEGDLDEAAEEKSRLEEKQREARKIRKKQKSNWEPMWFVSRPHKYAKEETWCYRGCYWERNFDNCPDIF